MHFTAFAVSPFPLHDSYSTLGLAADYTPLLPCLRIVHEVLFLHGSMNLKCVLLSGLYLECASPCLDDNSL